jgi:hypothetical protein
VAAQRTGLAVVIGVAAAAFAVGGCTATTRDAAGQVTAPSTADTFSVRVGDCLDKLPSDSTDSLTLLPCGQAHHWEAFATASLTGDDFPGSSAVREVAEKACDAQFVTFVGIAVNKSKLELTMLTPTKDTWTQAADREVVCLVGTPSGGITGTLKGANR